MIDLDHVASFMSVVACGGFREAALRMGLSQPTLTQHVKRLEQSLNVTLISRNNAGSTLTAEGRAFLPYAENLMRTCERAHALFEKKSLVVGASSNAGIYLLQPYLRAYQQQASHELDLVISDNLSIADRLERFEIDVAVMEWWDNRRGFAASIWRHEELVLIVPADHPWANRKSIPPLWLKGHHFLGGEVGTGTGRLLQQYLPDAAASIGVSMQLGSTEAVKHAVKAGLGISLVMAKSVEQEGQNGSLRVLSIENKPPVKDIYVIRRDTGLQDGPAQNFTRFLLSQ